jgi:hypothetical protein
MAQIPAQPKRQVLVISKIAAERISDKAKQSLEQRWYLFSRKFKPPEFDNNKQNTAVHSCTHGGDPGPRTMCSEIRPEKAS